MGDGPGYGIFVPLFGAVALSALLAAIGFAMRKRGRLRTRGPALIWAILTVLPLFGAGAVMFTRHLADEVTGKTKPGVSDYRARPAP